MILIIYIFFLITIISIYVLILNVYKYCNLINFKFSFIFFFIVRFEITFLILKKKDLYFFYFMLVLIFLIFCKNMNAINVFFYFLSSNLFDIIYIIIDNISNNSIAHCTEFKNVNFTETDFNYLEEQYLIQTDISKKLNILSRKDLFFKNDVNETIIPYDFIYNNNFIDSNDIKDMREKNLGGKQEIIDFLRYLKKKNNNNVSNRFFLSLKALIVENRMRLNNDLFFFNDQNNVNVLKKNQIQPFINTINNSLIQNYETLHVIKSHNTINTDLKKRLLLFLKSQYQMADYKGSLILSDNFFKVLNSVIINQNDINKKSFLEKLIIFQELNLVNHDQIVKLCAVGQQPHTRSLINIESFIIKFNNIKPFFENRKEITDIRSNIENINNNTDLNIFENFLDIDTNISLNNDNIENFQNNNKYFLDESLFLNIEEGLDSKNDDNDLILDESLFLNIEEDLDSKNTNDYNSLDILLEEDDNNILDELLYNSSDDDLSS